MITNLGASRFLDLLAGTETKFANSIAVGASSVVLPSTATSMAFGWGSAPITSTYVDRALSQVVFHATLDANSAGSIEEVGLVTSSLNTIAGVSAQDQVYQFSFADQWFTDATFAYGTSGKIGTQDLVLTNIGAGNSVYKYVSLNSLNYARIKIAISATAVSTIEIRLENDPSNYSKLLLNVSAGYGFYTFPLSSFTTTGSFNPQAISSIRIVPGTSNATNSLTLDGLIVESASSTGLVARLPLATPIVKFPGAPMEIERAVKF